MGTVLNRALRPKSFKGLFGQDAIISAIRKQMASKRIPQAYMFTGESGSGKTTMARILARSLNCSHIKDTNKFGTFCFTCYKERDKHKINLVEINGAIHRKVEQIEKMVELCNYAPIPPSRKRIFIIDEAHRLSTEAQNALLIPTEHPPKSTIWIICTTEAHEILKTLRRRFTIYAMQPIKHKVAEDFIKWAAEKANIKRDLYDLVEYVHKEGVTSPSIILDILEKYNAGLDPDRAAATSPTAVNTMRIAKGILAGEWGQVRPELDKAVDNDVRLIRAAILGLFKYELMQRTPGASIKLLVKSIETLGDISYGIDAQAQLAILSARCWSLCQEFRKR